jgi:hypothetical protein
MAGFVERGSQLVSRRIVASASWNLSRARRTVMMHRASTIAVARMLMEARIGVGRGSRRGCRPGATCVMSGHGRAVLSLGVSVDPGGMAELLRLKRQAEHGCWQQCPDREVRHHPQQALYELRDRQGH